jgi:ABC-type polysaccharide/polyol phosphate transport system ATPase subunit
MQFTGFGNSILDGEQFFQETLYQCSHWRASAYVEGHLPSSLDDRRKGDLFMDAIVIATAHLSKRYDQHLLAVDDLNLRIRKGEIYGFLGPNGAGKTTTLRMLLGLVRPTAGTGMILGRPVGTAGSLDRVGALVEVPTFYPYLSGRRNLLVLAHYAGLPSS